MKNLLLVFGVVLLASTISAQDVKESSTKMDAFASRTGVIIKFIDYALPNLSLKYGAVDVKIRKLISGGEIAYFYQISKKSKYDTKTASVAYDDIIEVLKAIQRLKVDSESDKASNPHYLENKFVTEDGFQLGYYVSDTKIQWYLVLEKFGSDNTIFTNGVSEIESAFVNARTKIDELKKQDADNSASN